MRSKEKIILEEEEYYNSVKRFIQKDGKIEFRLFTKEDIEKSIVSKTLVCVK